jgi:hypothetical protein
MQKLGFFNFATSTLILGQIRRNFRIAQKYYRFLAQKFASYRYFNDFKVKKVFQFGDWIFELFFRFQTYQLTLSQTSRKKSKALPFKFF